MFAFRHSLFAALLLWSVAACGDDDGSGPNDAGAEDASADAGPGDAGRRDAGQRDAGPMCTALPAVMGDGEAPTDPGIDPADFETRSDPLSFDAAGLPEEEPVFPLGVQAGSMTDASVLLWTFTEATDDPLLRVWRETDTPGEVVLVHESTVAVEGTDGYLRVPVEGLAPFTVYRYAFFETETAGPTSRSVIGRFRTAPAPGMNVKVRIAATTCTGSASEEQRMMTAPWPALSAMAEEEVDLLLHLGDFSYNDNSVSREEYRADWARTLGEQGYRDLLASTGYVATWDDHEVTNNFDPETIDPERLETAVDAFFESTAMVRNADGGLYNSFRWGDTVEVFVLDARSERRPSTRETDDPQFISDAQLTWLQNGLMSSEAHFKLVLTSVNITGLNGNWDIPLSRPDRWEGYEAQRIELLQYIEDNAIPHVFFLAGDIHMGFIARIEPAGQPFSKMWEITVGPGGSAANPFGALYELDPDSVAGEFQCDMFTFVHGKRQMQTFLELDPVANTVRVIFEDPLTGEVLFDDLLQQEPL